MSDAMATPEVSERVPLDQISETSVPNEESVRDVLLHTAPGSRAKIEDEAFDTAASVCVFTFAATAVVISAVVGADDVAMMKVRSSLTKSPVPVDPQLNCAGHVPCVDEEKS
jgi:hypothetical protein